MKLVTEIGSRLPDGIACVVTVTAQSEVGETDRWLKGLNRFYCDVPVSGVYLELMRETGTKKFADRDIADFATAVMTTYMRLVTAN